MAPYVPVGAILAFAADPSKLPPEWVVCDGRRFPASQYNDLREALNFLPSGINGQIQIPDLRGRFIRGIDSTTPAGQTHDWRTATPNTPIQVTVDHMGDTMKRTNKGISCRSIEWKDEARKFSVTGGDKETRPVNVALYFIIKITATGTDGLPIGTVFPSAGDNNRNPDPDHYPAYIRCDGVRVNAALQDVYDVVGNKFAPSSSPGTPSLFVPPNLAGKFIRGVDLEGVHDPDANSRGAAPDGIQKGLGTVQSYATALRSPSVQIKHYSKWYHDTIYPVEGDVMFRHGNTSRNSKWIGGDAESRPKNAAMHFYISSMKLDKQTPFPIGSIIAMVGQPTNIDEKVWLPCDGGSQSQHVFEALFNAIGITWGGSPANETFRVPSLNQHYLRGADIIGATKGDPDRLERRDIDNNPKEGAGSYQGYATAIPSTGLKIDIDYPTDKFNSSKTAVGDKSTESSGSKSFPLECNKWDNETAPASVFLRFYIRA